jgi:hypothetical protein
VRVTLPLEVYARAQAGLADLRLIDQEGSEVPYILQIRRGQKTQQWRSARLIESGFLPGASTQAVLDIGPQGLLHNSVALDMEEKNFFAWVEVAASDDLVLWRIVRERAPVFRFEEEGIPGNQLITYPETHARYVRLRILDKRQPFTLRSGRVAYELVEESEHAPLPVTLEPDPAAPAQQSWWRANLESAHVPVSAIRIAVQQLEFHRAVQVSVSPDGRGWQSAASGEIYRSPTVSGDRNQECLQVEFPEVAGRYWRVVVFNRDDPPWRVSPRNSTLRRVTSSSGRNPRFTTGFSMETARQTRRSTKWRGWRAAKQSKRLRREASAPRK